MNAGGPMESLVFAGRRFTSDGEDSVEVTLPGFENEVKVNGDGTQRFLKTPAVGAIEGINAVIDIERGDVEFLNEQQASFNFKPFTLTMCDGTVYSGLAQITDAVKIDLKEKTAEITLNGKFERL